MPRLISQGDHGGPRGIRGIHKLGHLGVAVCVKLGSMNVRPVTSQGQIDVLWDAPTASDIGGGDTGEPGHLYIAVLPHDHR